MKTNLPCAQAKTLSSLLLRVSKSIMLLFLVSVTSLCFSYAYAGSIATDKADYAPGETVHISGDGWSPGETVTLQVLHVDGGDNTTSGAHAPWTINADANGNVSATWVVPTDQDELNSSLKVTATAASGTATAYFTDGTYTLKFYAADPAVNTGPFLPTYQKLAPSLLACSAAGGRASNPLPNAVAYAPPANSSDLDAVTSLAPKDMALCQVVPFFVEITVSGSTTAENGVITFSNDFLAKTTSGGDFGFDPGYGLYCAFVDYAEAGTIDPGGNAKVDSYSSTTLDLGGSNERTHSTVQVSGLEDGDHVIVELWVVLKCSIPDGSSGNVQTSMQDAHTGPINTTGNTINTGNQTVPLLKVQEFFTADADIQVTKTSNPVCLGKDITYNIEVKNNATSTIANGAVATDVLGAGQTFVSASGAPYTYDGTTRTVTFSIGAVTQLQTINLTVVATANTTPSVSNSVSVTEITSDPDGTNNTSSITTTVNPLPTCSITGGVETINAGSSTHWCAADNMKSYSWTGPNNFTATTQCVDVSDEGDYYVTITNSTDCQSTCSRHLTVQQCTTPPNAGTDGALTVCVGTTVSNDDLFNALTGSPDADGTWTGPVNGIYTYTVKATAPCTEDATSHVTVTEQSKPNAGTDGALTVCVGTTLSDADLFAALTGSPQAGGTWSGPVNGVYTYTVKATAPCTEDATSHVTVTEQSKPNAGTDGALTVCVGTTVSNDDLLNALTGSPDAGGTWTGPVNGVYTYTVKATAPCTEDATSHVTVTEQSKPNAGTDGSLKVCAGTTPTNAQLFAALSGSPQTGGTWTGPVGGVYTYTVKATSPCTVDATSHVTVTEQSKPNAGTDGSLKVCAGTTPSDADLFAALTGSPDAGGTWSDPVNGVYAYTVKATAPCTEDATSTVTVTTQSKPNAGTSGALTVCAGTTPTNAQLFAALTGSPDAGGTWTGPVAGVYTYTVTTTAPCTMNATSHVTVTEQSKPNAGTDGALSVCAGTTPTQAQLFAQLGGSPQLGGTWTGPVNGVYTYTVKATSPCSVDATSHVTVTSNPVPSCTISNLCVPNSHIVGVGMPINYSGPAGAGYAYSWSFTSNTAGATFSGGATTATTKSVTVTTTTTGSYTLSLRVTDNSYTTKCNSICTYAVTVNTSNGYYTYTQGYYSSTGTSCTPVGGVKGSLALIQYSINNMPGQRIYLGKAGHSFTALYADAATLVKIMPGGGTASSLAADYDLATNTSTPAPPLKNGKLANVLLSQAITLALNEGIQGDNLKGFVLHKGYLTTQKGDLSTCPVTKLVSCSKDASTISSLKLTNNTTLMSKLDGQTVDSLLRMASNALGGTLPSGVTYADITNAIDVINKSFDGGRFWLGYFTSAQTCSTILTAVASSSTVRSLNVSQLSVKAYPNPFNSSISFNITAPVTGRALLEVYDLNGKKLAVVYDGTMSEGSQRTINFEVPAGIRVPMMYQFTIGDKTSHGLLMPEK